VPLRHVAQLVRHHRGQLVARAHHPDQAQVQPQVAARQGKGIHGAVTPQQHLPRKALVQLGRQLAPRPRRRHQRLPDALHIFANHRVIDVVRVAVQLANDAVAQPPLLTAGQVAAIPQGWKPPLCVSRQGACHANRYQKRSCQRLTGER